MRRTKEVKLKSEDESLFSAIVKELTVAEIRQWLLESEREKVIEEVEASDVDRQIATLLFSKENVTFFDLAFMSDMEWKAMIPFAPSELEKLLTACKELNQFFFQILALVYETNTEAFRTLNIQKG